MPAAFTMANFATGVIATPDLLQVHLGAASHIVLWACREEGSNGDREMAAAVYMAGLQPWDVTMSDLLSGCVSLSSFQGAQSSHPQPSEKKAVAICLDILVPTEAATCKAKPHAGRFNTKAVAIWCDVVSSSLEEGQSALKV